MEPRAISYGGGVQSTALMVMAARGTIRFKDIVFANVGDQAESPATLAYIEEHARPFAEAHGLRFHERRWVMRSGRVRDLYEDLMSDNRSIDIPVKMQNGAPGNRKCTATYKIQVVQRWSRENGATRDNPATIAVGISTDEMERASSRHSDDIERVIYPLLDLRISRNDCRGIIEAAGLPVPPKSSCWFCPFKRPLQWSEMRRDDPELFAKAVALEERLNVKRRALGKDAVYLATRGRLLSQMVEAGPSLFDGPDACDSWGCWT